MALDETSIVVFQIICIAVIILGLITYPWIKKPWVKYAGQHTLGWVLIWLGGVCALILFSKSALHRFLIGLVSISSGLIGAIVIIRNYLK